MMRLYNVKINNVINCIYICKDLDCIDNKIAE